MNKSGSDNNGDLQIDLKALVAWMDDYECTRRQLYGAKPKPANENQRR